MMDFPSSDLPHPKKRRRTVSRPSPSSDLGESQTSGLNPLLIGLVLQNLFKFCNKKELDQYRLVCKPWHQESLPFWTKQLTTINLMEDAENPNSHFPKPINLVRHESKQPSMRSFLAQVHSPSSSSLSPYEFPGVRKAPKFSIESLTPRIDTGVLTSFWENSGPWITHLKLTEFYCQDLSLFKDIVCSRFTPSLEVLWLDPEFPPNFINLQDNRSSRRPDDEPRYIENPHFKSLSIMIYVEKEEDGDNLMSEFPLEWSQILGLYPNLEAIAISNLWLAFQAEFKRILVAIKDIREKTPEKLKSLKSIDALHDESTFDLPGDQLDRSVVDLLRHPLLHLNFSSLGLRFDVVTDEQLGILRDILSSQATSLKKLQFFMPMHFRPVRLGIVPSLEILHTYGFPFSSFSFLRSFPNLRSLKLHRDSDHGTDDEGSIMVENSRGEEEPAVVVVPLHQLTEFDCDYKFGGLWGPEVIHKMRDWMPNISILKMVLDNDMFHSLCMHFPNLEELVVLGDGLSDRAIAGCIMVGMPPKAAVSCSYYTSITAFHQLKSFEMGIRRKRIAKWFTYHSVIHGFAKLPQLCRFEISFSVKIRPSVIPSIKEHLPFAKIHENW